MGKKRLKYKRNLIVALVFLQLLTVVLTLSLSRISTENVLINQAYQLLENATSQSIYHTRTFLKPAYKTNQSISNLLTKGVISAQDTALIQKLFLSELSQNDSFAGLYLSTIEGDFTYVLRSKERPNAIYQTKIIKHTDKEGEALFYWWNKNLQIISKEKQLDHYYNALTRPWYKLAIAKKNIAWTKPYTFFTSKKPGITIASPFYNNQGKIIGVLGIDIELTKISTFLGTISKSLNGYIVIFDQEGNLVSSADTGLQHTIERQIKAKNQTILKDIKKIWPQKTKKTVVINNTEYLTTHNQLRSSINQPEWGQPEWGKPEWRKPEWIITTLMEKEPLLKEIRIIEKKNMMIGISIFFFSITISWIFAISTSKPVEAWMKQARTDYLTKLYNRHHFFTVGKKVYERLTHDTHDKLSLLMIDIDHFKRVNDNYGHSIGDIVLKGIAVLLQNELRADDLIARIGGEEFILLLPKTDSKMAVYIAERIRKLIKNNTIQTHKGPLSITVSIGIATSTNHPNLPFLEFIDIADKALYHSKKNGRDKVSKSTDITAEHDQI